MSAPTRSAAFAACCGARRLLDPPHVPRPGEEERAPRLELEHAGRDRLEEPAVVRDQDHRRVERLQLLLEPLEVLDVEVVRRLVQQQQVGIAGERAGERGARQLAAGERRPAAGRGRARRSRGRAAPPSRGRATCSRPRARAAPALPRTGRSVACVVVARGHRLLQRAQLLLGLDQVARAGERVLAQRQPAVERRPLVVEGDSRALGEGELAAVDLAFADEHPQQRRLAGAVRAGEREPLAPLDRERDALEEQRPGELLAQVGTGDDHECMAKRRVRADAGARARRRQLFRARLRLRRARARVSDPERSGSTHAHLGPDGSAEFDAGRAARRGARRAGRSR